MTIHITPTGQAIPDDLFAVLTDLLGWKYRREIRRRGVTLPDALPTYEFSKGETVH